MAAFSAIAFSSLAGYWLWDHRGYWLADNLREVEPGRIYAGGYQYSWPLERIIRRYRIKTVLSLREGNDSFERQERAVLDANGVQFRKVVIPYKVPEDVRIAAIEQAIALIADEQNHPIYVHCWAGCHRTGAVLAIYRVSRCHWTEEAASKELVSWGGTTRGAQWPTRVLRAYCMRVGDSEPVARHPEPASVR
jgi:hypothetical protein